MVKKELAPSPGVNAYVAVAHVPPFSGDFDTALEASYVDKLNSSPNTLAALYAHNHKEEVRFLNNEDIPYITTNSIGKRRFLVVDIVNGELKYESILY